MAVVKFLADADPVADGPEWLRTLRRDAARSLESLAVPTTDEEEWRYGRIDDLDTSRYSLVDGPVAVVGTVPEPARSATERLGALSGLVVIHNGVVVHRELYDDAVAKGVSIDIDSPGAEATLGAALAGNDVFLAANTAFSPEPVVITVPAGVTLEAPIAVVSHADADRAVIPTRTALRVGADSDVALVEVRLSDPVDSMLVPVTELVVEHAARLRHGVVQDHGAGVWQIGSLAATVAADASFRSGVAALGGQYSRLRTDCRLEGRGASGELCCVYFGENDETLDFRTFQEHLEPDTTSNLLFKGAVADRSHSVYTGMIRIHSGARGSNAYQTNANLKLSDEAWAESVPNLEINNNDVHCSHASTVGPVDEDQRFYLESRGVPTAVADRLIVGGFFDEVLDALPVPEIAPAVRHRLDGLLDRLVAAP